MIAGPGQVRWSTSFVVRPPASWTACARSANSCSRIQSPTWLVPTDGTLPMGRGFARHSACSAPACLELGGLLPDLTGSRSLVTDLLLTGEKLGGLTWLTAIGEDARTGSPGLR
jgi:hypothetical protein